MASFYRAGADGNRSARRPIFPPGRMTNQIAMNWATSAGN
jgi:hypothetical protein